MQEKDQNRREARSAGDRLVAGHVSEDPLAAAFKATRMPMIVTDPSQPDNPIIFCNGAVRKLTGYCDDEIIGRNCRFLQGPETDRETVSKIRDSIAAGQDVAVDILNYRKDGSTFWNAVFIRPVRDEADKIIFSLPPSLISQRSRAGKRISQRLDIRLRQRWQSIPPTFARRWMPVRCSSTRWIIG